MTRSSWPGVTAGISLVGLLTFPGSAVSQSSAAEVVRLGKEYVGSLERPDQIRTLDALAECSGPGGPFTTRVLSHRDGKMVFRQTYEDAPGFLAGIHGGRAWQAPGDSGKMEVLDESGAAFLRGHEFLMTALAPEARLSEPSLREEVTVFAGTVARTVEFRDVADRPFLIHYAVDSGRPLGYTQRNPTSDGPPRIEVELTDWHEVEGLRLPGRLTITHGPDLWHYHFVRVRVNSLDPEDFDPEALLSGGP